MEARLGQKGFAEAINEHYAGIVQRITLVLHDSEEAQDVAQETYFKAYKSWAEFDGNSTRAWLHTIALRIALNRERSLRRRWGALARLQQQQESWIPDEYIDMWAAMEQIPSRQRAALLMNAVDGYSQAEIARILRAPPGTIAGWIASAKASLRRELSA
jgi:RNA polymerase sigma-70 factor (ECF subfamily)